MPHHDPVPSPSHTAIRRFRRTIRIMGLVSIGCAVVAVVLVGWGVDNAPIHMLIATALGVGLSVFLATALMSLVFLSANSGHDERASRIEEEDDQ